MLRPTAPDDTDTLVSQAAATQVFKPHEIEALQEVLEDYHATNQGYGHVCWTWMEAEKIAGFVYFASTAMTDRTWELWWIVVDPTVQGRGLGSKMLAAVESEVQRLGARIFLIETSSLPNYHPTRQFYLKHGYVEAARIADFYSDGDDKVIFSKRIAQ